MRIDHWIKQFFIMPGVLFAVILLDVPFHKELALRILLGFIATCFTASANYVINEWLDAGFDKYHPIKKHRAVVENHMDPRIVYSLYGLLTICGFLLAIPGRMPFFLMIVWLWVMGILYNVKPFRTKDIVYVDVLTESINNAIRLLLGWFIVTDCYFPPISIVIGYWMTGAFLMATKRYSEYRMINDPATASLYRKSFAGYSEKSLLLSAFFYAMSANLFIGIFLIKYRIELVIFMPFLMGLFCYYFNIAFKHDSAVQNPEKLYREKGLILFVLFLCILFVLLMLVRIPILSGLVDNELIRFQGTKFMSLTVQ